MGRLSVELKLFVAVLAVCVACALTTAYAAGTIFEKKVEEAGVAALENAAHEFAAQERSEIEKLASTLDALLANDRLREAFIARDRKRLLEITGPLLAVMRDRDRVTHWYFIEPDPARTVFLRVHRPEMHGDRVDRVTLRKAIETRELGAGKELGKTAFALRVVRPWFHEKKLIGYMELAEEIDHFLEAMKLRTGDEYGLIVKKKLLDEKAWAALLTSRAKTWNDRPDVVVVDATTFSRGIIDYEGDIDAIPDRGEPLGEVVQYDSAFVRGIFPVRDAAGRKVAGLFVLHDFTHLHAAMRVGLVQTFLALLVIGVVAASVIWASVHALVFSRLARVRWRLEGEAAAAGLLPKPVRLGSDEIGRFEELFRALLASRGRAAPDRVRRASDGGGDRGESSTRAVTSTDSR